VAIGRFPGIGGEEQDKPERKADKKEMDKSARDKPAMPKDPMACGGKRLAYIRSLAQVRAGAMPSGPRRQGVKRRVCRRKKHCANMLSI
jgi:hypothetical protein